MVRRDMIDLSYLRSHSTFLRIGYCYWGANKACVNEPAKRIYLIAELFLTSGMPLPVAAADEHMVVGSPNGLKWGAAPPAIPKGAQLAVVSGDPSGADFA